MQPPTVDESVPEPRIDASLLGQIETRFRELSAADTVLDLNRIGIPAWSWVRHVRRLLGHPTITYDQRDVLWRDVLWFARPRTASDLATLPRRFRQQEVRASEEWKVVALGLAMPGLRHAVRTRLGNHTPDERDEIQADLVTGFLASMTTIDTRRRNVCGRLIAAAARHAHTRQTERRTARARLTLDGEPMPAVDRTAVDMVDVIAASQALHRLPLHPTDRQLIEMTRVKGHTLATAARELGISLSAATSRRDRAEQRLAIRYRRQRTSAREHNDTTE